MKVCRHQRASTVWEGPSMAHTSKAMIQYTSLDASTPSTIWGDYKVHVSRDVIHTSDSMEEPRDPALVLE